MDILVERKNSPDHLWTLLTYAVEECVKLYDLTGKEEITGVVMPVEMETLLFDHSIRRTEAIPHGGSTLISQLGFLPTRLFILGIPCIPSRFIGKGYDPTRFWVSFV